MIVKYIYSNEVLISNGFRINNFIWMRAKSAMVRKDPSALEL